MFWLGALPALLALYIRTKVPESEAWRHHRAGSMGEVLRVVASNYKRFLYLVVLMVFMMFLSHGTQDLYPDFLKEIHKVAPSRVANIAMIYNVGAVIGAGRFGLLSPSLGRGKGMMGALGVFLLAMPILGVGWGGPVRIPAPAVMPKGVQG